MPADPLHPANVPLAVGCAYPCVNFTDEVPNPGPTPADLALATRIWQMADRRGFGTASCDRKRARFLAGRVEHGDDLATLDLLGEAMEEVDDTAVYLMLAFVFDPRPELIAAIIKVREMESAIVACRIPPLCKAAH